VGVDDAIGSSFALLGLEANSEDTGFPTKKWKKK